MTKNVCFTGHRPQQLPFEFHNKNKDYIKLKKNLTNTILSLINEGYTNFISGMAIGIDTLCAEIILELKKKNKQIKLLCYLPCKNQTRFWNNYDAKKYHFIIDNADEIKYATFGNYCIGCLQLRNKMMVNDSDTVVAVFYNKDGGTKYTINYAISQNKKIIYVNEK